MEYHTKITLLNHPWIWTCDKYRTGFNAKGLYSIAFLPSILALIGFFVNICTFYKLEPVVYSDVAVIFLGSFLFVFGLINLVFLHLIAQAKVRLGRERDNYHVLHKDVIEKIRDYRAHRRLEKTETEIDGKNLGANEIKKHISEILELFLKSYLYRMHPGEASAVIKYKHPGTDELVPIRVGNDAKDRDTKPEKLDKSYIYQALTAPGKTLRYIYVKNLDSPDKYECRALGTYTEGVQGRAKSNGYPTFIALPIRSGRIKDSMLSAQNTLGMLGLDLKTKYGFGNFEEHEQEYLACFVDMMSELVQDLIDAEGNQAPNKMAREVE